MGGFSADWLSLREPADARSRNSGVLERLGGVHPVILDLGAGTGANLRWLAPRFGFEQHWILIDNDPALLASAIEAIRSWAGRCGGTVREGAGGLEISAPGFGCTVSTRMFDLSRDLHRLELPPGSLVTASALLDLVSRSWLERLVALVASGSASALFALTYSGRVTFDPTDAEDEAIVTSVNRHQLTDKGFGPALGPDAHAAACELLSQAGLAVRDADSSWRCGPEDGSLMEALIAGWAEAATEISPAAAPGIESWRCRRSDLARGGKLRLTVSHRDLVAVPGGRDAGSHSGAD